ncbi:hypothetical protein [uncultured Clostridium sp.]|uniref:hypothetical protein n=1 Tax=uncultured Clostridium sp. TaxID=59620 RepID=UPI002591CBB3|nr:hypothetical protein [uncultured Clostridium sp.]
MNKIIIKEPYIQENKLCSEIETETEYNMWFEVEEENVKYLCCEKADAFLVAILPYAIKHELDIEVEAKISAKLYYQLNTCLLPLLCEYFKKRTIKINADTDNSILNNENAVGTGISMGIDSLYSILKNSNLKTKEFNVTHLTFFNAGASGRFGGEKARNLYNIRKEQARRFSAENGLKFVCVDSNMNEFLMMSHVATHTFRSVACVLALQKLFSKYYYASLGKKFNATEINEDPGYYDILLLQCLSNENLQFYSDGVGISRLEKVKELAKHSITYKWLNVCIGGEKNCGHCPKCIRTLLELESIGVLDKYKNVFNLKDFAKNRTKFLGYMIEQKPSNIFFKEIYDEYKKNNIKIPIVSYFIAFFSNMKKKIKQILKAIVPKKLINKIRKRNESEIVDEWW